MEGYGDVLKKQMIHGLDIEKKYIKFTMKKMFKVELAMIKKEIEQVKKKLEKFEKQHKMKSEVFIKKFNAGELGDDKEYIRWYAYADTHNKLTERAKGIEMVLND
ncbi:MAG: hypothetical protein ABH874_03635 [Methanobacteriota archaeon]|jgi:hypothetical protein